MQKYALKMKAPRKQKAAVRKSQNISKRNNHIKAKQEKSTQYLDVCARTESGMKHILRNTKENDLHSAVFGKIVIISRNVIKQNAGREKVKLHNITNAHHKQLFYNRKYEYSIYLREKCTSTISTSLLSSVIVKFGQKKRICESQRKFKSIMIRQRKHELI